jgi:hypothetical protein
MGTYQMPALEARNGSKPPAFGRIAQRFLHDLRATKNMCLVSELGFRH